MRHYHQAAIESANGVQLIVALYDGLQRFLTQAADACEAQDEAARREAARRALNIVIHLQASLRMDAGGASAERLSDFYTAVFADVLRASASASRQLFMDTAREVRNVREAWKSRRSGSCHALHAAARLADKAGTALQFRSAHKDRPHPAVREERQRRPSMDCLTAMVCFVC